MVFFPPTAEEMDMKKADLFIFTSLALFIGGLLFPVALAIFGNDIEPVVFHARSL